MSERTFARRFAAETGTTPHKWLDAAADPGGAQPAGGERPVGRADRHPGSGFNSAVVLREHFRRTVGVVAQ